MRCTASISSLQNRYDSLLGERTILENQIKSINDEKKALQIINDSLAKKYRAEIIRTNNSIVDYFSAIAEVARNYPPPFKNAANGNFRNTIANSVDINNLADPKIISATIDAKCLLDVFKAFAQENQKAFISRPNYRLPHNGCCGSNACYDLNAVEILLSVGNDIVELFATGGTDVPTWAQTAGDFAGIYQQVNSQGCNNRGGAENANGFIALDVNNAAKMALDKLDNCYINDSSQVGKIESVLRDCFRQLLTLDTANEGPWLKPEWELKYYAIMKATSEKLAIAYTWN